MAETKTKYSEEELLELLRQRSEPAFNYLYDNYSSALYTIIFNIVRKEESSSDVLQEVFLKIWKQIDSYDSSKGRLFTWMLNISRNAAIDTIRSKTFKNTQRNRELKESVYDAAGTAEIKVDSIGLKKWVDGLKPEFKQLLELAYFQGFTQDEISKALDIPLGTVKTRIRTGLQQLRAMMTENG
jgi:RNA polymerase sigma factor (sigma-70 family)